MPGIYSRGLETLTLNRDSTFGYMYRYEQPLYVSNGTWKAVDTKIALSSYYNPDSLPISVVEKLLPGESAKVVITPKDSVKFSYLFPQNLEYRCVINGVPGQFQEQKSFVIADSKSIRTIRIEIRHSGKEPLIQLYRKDLATKTYSVNSFNVNYFECTIPLEVDLFNSIYINDEIDFQGKRIIWPKKGLEPFKKVQ